MSVYETKSASGTGESVSVSVGWDVNNADDFDVICVKGATVNTDAVKSWNSTTTTLTVSNPFGGTGTWTAYVRRKEAPANSLALNNNGTVDVNAINTQFGKDTRVMEQSAELAGRTLRTVDAVGEISNVNARKGKVLAFDTDGNPDLSLAKEDVSGAYTSRDQAASSASAAAASAATASTKAAAAEASRAAADTAKTAAQTAKADAIAAKTAAETAQAAAESAKTDALSAKTAAVSAKTGAETAKDAAISAKTAAESAKTAAQTAKADAETAKADAQTAKTAAQTAKSGAETAKDAAVAAKTAAETAKTDAQTAKTDAETAKTAAQSSAESASNSAAAAANSLNFYNALAYQGTCTALPSNPTRGQFWVVAQAFDSYAAGDAILYNGTAWQSLDLDTLTAQAQADARAQTNAAIAARGMARCPNIQCACADFGTFPLSICFSYRRNAAWVNATYVAYKVTSGPGAAAPHFVVYVGGNANHFIFGFTKNTPTGGGLHVAFPIAKFPTDGRLHTVVFTLASGTFTDGKCYIDGNFVPYTGPGEVSFGTITDFANTSEMTLGLMNISLSRMKIFNFALPATATADCALATPYGYSAEAYANGEDEPTALRDTSATARALLSLDDRTCGGVLFDRSGAENHARFTGDAAPEKPAESCAFTQALSWAGTSEAKAFLNANAIALPANARVCARLKASAGATFNLTDGAATPTTLATSGALTADAWGEVVFYTSAASKLALKPTAAYTGTLDVQVRIEKLK